VADRIAKTMTTMTQMLKAAQVKMPDSSMSAGQISRITALSDMPTM